MKTTPISRALLPLLLLVPAALAASTSSEYSISSLKSQG